MAGQVAARVLYPDTGIVPLVNADFLANIILPQVLERAVVIEKGNAHVDEREYFSVLELDEGRLDDFLNRANGDEFHVRWVGLNRDIRAMAGRRVDVRADRRADTRADFEVVLCKSQGRVSAGRQSDQKEGNTEM